MDHFCPPHTYPRRWPWAQRICDEPCHTHTSVVRRFFHNVHCGLLGCPIPGLLFAPKMRRPTIEITEGAAKVDGSVSPCDNEETHPLLVTGPSPTRQEKPRGLLRTTETTSHRGAVCSKEDS